MTTPNSTEREQVKINMARFEAAMDQLSRKVERTGQNVRQTVELAKEVQKNSGPLVLTALGLLGGFVLGRLIVGGYGAGRKRLI